MLGNIIPIKTTILLRIFTHPYVQAMWLALLLTSIGEAQAGDSYSPSGAETETQPASSLPPDQADQVNFPIKRIDIVGNTFVSTERLQNAVSPFLTEAGNINQLQAALQAIEKAYAQAGYTAVRAVLPEQEADNGVFRIEVIEAKVGAIRVTGNQHFDAKNILRTAPDLLSGQAPNLQKVAKTLRIANESFAKNARVIISRSEKDGEVDAEIQVTDIRPWRIAMSLDNTGTPNTGNERASFVFQHANMLNRDHAMALQYTTSPGHSETVSIFGLSYRIPLYRFGDTVDISVGHSDVSNGNVVTTAGNFGISGSGDFAAIHYNFSLPAWRELERKLVFSLNWRSFQSNVVPQGAQNSLIPDLTSAPASISYVVNSDQNQTTRWLGSLGWVYNLPSGNEGDTTAYNQLGARPGAVSSFHLLKYNASLQRPLFGNWTFRSELAGQWTEDMLITGEQFGLGGAYNVRGFLERELAGDTGYRGTFELTTPPWLIKQLPDVRSYASVFYDFGQMFRNNALPAEVAQEGISSIGIGMRSVFGQKFQIKADMALVQDAGALRREGEWRAHVLLLVLF